MEPMSTPKTKIKKHLLPNLHKSSRTLPFIKISAPWKKRQKGFTLIEVIIVVVVLSIAVGTLLTVVANVMRATVLPEVINISTGLAEQELERVTVQRFSAVATEASSAFASPFDDYTRQVTVSNLDANLSPTGSSTDYKQVVVTVSHGVGGDISLTSVVVNN